MEKNEIMVGYSKKYERENDDLIMNEGSFVGIMSCDDNKVEERKI